MSKPEPLVIAAEPLTEEQRKALSRFEELLAGAGVERGLIGPREVPRLWERHLENSAVVALSPLVPSAATVADVGSGAGLPGLVWALVRPDIRVTLIESMERRCAFLREAVEALSLGDQVTVLRARAEDAQQTLDRLQRSPSVDARPAATAPAGEGRSASTPAVWDVVTARAVAPLERLIPLTWPLVGTGGALLAMKGSKAAEEIAQAQRTVLRPGALDSGQTECELITVLSPDSSATVVRLVKHPRGV